MDENLYDEFGNYIGKDFEEEIVEKEIEIEIEEDIFEKEEEIEITKEKVTKVKVESKSVVLHEDKKYYPSVIFKIFNFLGGRDLWV